jgi:predicted nucleotidyltransferase
MFTVNDREQIQANLIRLAATDEQLSGAALVGSSATGEQDDLSDIDLALQIVPGLDINAVIDRWTALVREQVKIAHTLDVIAGNGVLYRVFLTHDSMQIDISFWPHDEFRATGDRFRLLFGTANEALSPTPPDAHRLIGMAWLYGLHVRSAIARNEPWHALLLLDDMRDFVLTLACLRHGANAHQLRGVDSLPTTLLDRFSQARSATLEMHELKRSLTMHVNLLMNEVATIDAGLVDSLHDPLELIGGITG